MPNGGEAELSCFSSVESDADTEPPSTKAVTAAVNRNSIFSHVPEKDWNNWKWQFRNRITTVDGLARFIPLSADEQAQLKLVTARYPLSVTPYYLSLINLDDPNDPVRRQAIPSIQELTLAGMGTEDPLEEKRDSVVPGLVHRYPDRVLMVLTDICPMLCRHCTRKREWQHGGWVRTEAEVEAMLDYIRSNKKVRDVIMSGGDLLTLSTQRLEQVISKLRQIPHVEIIRIGSRYPVVLPQRIDDELCAMLSRYGPIWLNTHFNHYRELTPESAAACDRLLRAGVPVNNQSVLLRGINDTAETQLKLCQGLLKIKVRPYYLFQCDEVQGTEHLRTPVEVGIKIMEKMRGWTSGLALPSFVIDLPNGGGKVPIQPEYVLSHNGDELILKNYQGRIFRYRNPAGSVLPKANRKNGKSRVFPNLPLQAEFQWEGVKDEDRALVRS
ncbi:MAG: KamA family radical SAM protein [Chloroflexi bacterium]|nr:KamA family radical SAM protein [Chloroflexota bacterium]